MKKLTHFLPAFLILVLTTVSCSKEDEPAPDAIANFSITKNEFLVDENINFINLSQNCISYLWDFGDGNVSMEETPTHWYKFSGSFKVTLTVTGANGNIHAVSERIEVTYPEPIASFELSKNAIKPDESLTITNYSENAISYLWDFGDGNTSTEESPTHTYSETGEYTIKLTAFGEDEENTTSSSVIIYNIEPGVSIGPIELFKAFSDLDFKYDWYDTVESNGHIYHKVDFPDLQLFVYLKSYYNEFNLNPNDYVFQINTYGNSDAITSKGIKIGSSLSEVEDAYGKPNTDNQENKYYYYNNDEDGLIVFYYNTQSEVKSIVIY